MTLEEIKKCSYELLLKFKGFCEQHGLKFFLSNGTLLGAVKYGGFIPWDDDVDVFLPREDYDRFVAEFEDSEGVKLFAMERQKGYKFPFAKLCDIHTLKIEKIQPVDRSIDLGICIDVFPLDDYSNCRLISKIQAEIIRFKLAMYSFSQMESFEKKNPFKKIIYKTARIIGFENISRFVLWKPKKSQNIKKYCGNRVWAIYGSREVLSKEDFGKTETAKFEEEEFPIPRGYDNYLTSLYGDYRKDPPIDKQKTHHSYEAYKLD